MDEVIAALLKAGAAGVVIGGIILILREVKNIIVVRRDVGRLLDDQSLSMIRSEVQEAVTSAMNPFIAQLNATLAENRGTMQQMMDLNRQFVQEVSKIAQAGAALSAGMQTLVQLSQQQLMNSQSKGSSGKST